MSLEIVNIFVCGTGGRGVQRLSNVLRALASDHGYLFEGATFKGGAQRMGTVYAEIRLYTGTQNLVFSSQIPKGKTDVLIALEPWEALRFASHCSDKTRALINSDVELLFSERYSIEKQINPMNELKNVFTSPIVKNYGALSKEISGSKRMANMLMLLDAIEMNLLPFDKEKAEALMENYE